VSMDEKRYDVIVIGAGHNGLTAAARLAQKGQRVLVVEKRSVIGGMAAAEEFAPGYKAPGLFHDTSTLWQQPLNTLKLEHCGLKFQKHPHSVFLPQPVEDGKGLLLHGEPLQAAKDIAQLSPGDAESYLDYHDWQEKIRSFIRGLLYNIPPAFLKEGPPNLWPLLKKSVSLRMLGEKNMMELLRVVTTPVQDFLNEWFHTELIKAGLAAPALYGTFTGPRSPATTANLLLYHAACHQPLAGDASLLIDALENRLHSYGVEILTDAEVQEILAEKGQTVGVQLTDGQRYTAQRVAASCSPKHTFLDLLPVTAIAHKTEHRIQHFRARGTTVKMHLALRKPVRFACRPALEVEFARIPDNMLDQEKAFDAVKYRQFSQNPILDLYVPTVRHTDWAPKGHSVLSVLVHFAPYHLEGGWDEQQKEMLADNVMGVLRRYIPDIQEHIEAQELLSPKDIEQRYGTTEGHIFHGEHSLDQMLVRPIPECAQYTTPIKGLFLCGSGSHPGGGLTCAPGALAAQAILQSE